MLSPPRVSNFVSLSFIYSSKKSDNHETGIKYSFFVDSHPSPAIWFGLCQKRERTLLSITGTSSLFPLANNNLWNYRLKLYDTTTGVLTDSLDFTVTITGQITIDGVTYYQFANSLNASTIELLTSINSTTLGSVDSAYGITPYTFFVSGVGDSTESLSAWPIMVTENGSVCEGTDKLYGHYADTTLINLDGTVYTNSMKNVIVSYDCGGTKWPLMYFS